MDNRTEASQEAKKEKQMIRYYIDGKRIPRKDFQRKVNSKAFMRKYHHYAMVADTCLPVSKGFTVMEWVRFLTSKKKKRK